MDYISLLNGVDMFKEEWGKDRWYTKHLLRDRNVWEKLDSITVEQVENVVIEFLRQYWVQYTYDIDRDELKKVLQGLNGRSNILRGKKLLDLDFNEKVGVEREMTTWVSEIIREMYSELKDVYGIGVTSASKILHGINPELFMMWDRFIRPGYWYPKYNANDMNYLNFMKDCQKILGRVVDGYSQRHNCDIEVAVKKICEQAYPELEVKKPLAKLLDEYNWMKYRNKKDLADPWK